MKLMFLVRTRCISKWRSQIKEYLIEQILRFKIFGKFWRLRYGR